MHRKVPRLLLWRVASTVALFALLGTHVNSAVIGQEPLVLQQETSQPAGGEPAGADAASATLTDTEEAHVPPSDRYFLMESLQGSSLGEWFESNRIQVFGWTDMTFTGSTADKSNLPLGFNYRANQFNLQQNWLRIERPVDTSSTSEPTFGFLSDTILPGTDYVFTLARGLFSSQLTANNGHPNLYGIDPIQFYVEGYFPTIGRGVDVKVGRFFALYGVEVTPSINNALASHCYADVYDPFTHTGILVTTKLTDTWSIQAGAVLGSDVFIDPADSPTFIGSAQWVSSDQRDTALFSIGPGTSTTLKFLTWCTRTNSTSG